MNEEEKKAIEYSKNCLMKITLGIDCEFDVNILDTLLNTIKKLQKENEELKEYNIDYKRILDLADNRTYRKKYLEERRKEQPNLLYPDGDEIYQRYYELQKENEDITQQRDYYKARYNEFNNAFIEGGKK